MIPSQTRTRQMVHSDYANAAAAAVSYVKSSVRYRGLNTAGGWIRHPTEVEWKFASRIATLVLGIKMDAEYKGDFNGEYYVNQLEKLAKQSKTGNCSELSAVAFNYLKNQG